MVSTVQDLFIKCFDTSLEYELILTFYADTDNILALLNQIGIYF